MKKIITGFGEPIQLEGAYNPTSWDVRIFEVNGHREISMRNSIDWEEVPFEPVVDQSGTMRSDEQEEERRQANLKRSARRAQSMCRKVIKSMAFDEMMTLTYRENQGDRALAKKHFKEWARRMKRALGGFAYCASFERQERGAMHVHIATHTLPQYGKFGGVKIKAWQLGTKIWRSVVGADNGMCFVGGRNKKGGKRTKKLSLARMAQYVSKYIMKDYEDAPEESNRYSRSDGIHVPKAVSMRFNAMTMAEMIALVFQCDDGDVIVSHRVDAMNSAYWLCTEPDPGGLHFAIK
jgi:hypothetical protein